MIRMTKMVREDIIKHALLDSPIEACGYLGAADGIITTCYRMRNTDDSGEHFTLDPDEQFSVIRDMRKDGTKLSAVYHSHPETPARPSEEDIRLAYDPEVSYVIVSLADGEANIRSFLIREGTVEPEKIEIIGS